MKISNILSLTVALAFAAMTLDEFAAASDCRSSRYLSSAGSYCVDANQYHWARASDEQVTWTRAKQLCDELTLGGFRDWRLPTFDELRYFVTLKPEDSFAGLDDFIFSSETSRNKVSVLFLPSAERLAFEQDKAGIAICLGRAKVVLQNDLGMTFAKITKGAFWMGTPSPKSEGLVEGPELLHHVTITNDFFMQSTEVTQGQWFRLMKYNPSKFVLEQDCPGEYQQVGEIGICPNNPVENISWVDAKRFIAKMNEMNDGYLYRLPTEAEWEFAARAGKNGPYSSAGNVAEFAWFRDTAAGNTHPVAKLKPNANGLYDMYGNVWEWVNDGYRYFRNIRVTDPSVPQKIFGRVIRGGAWLNGEQEHDYASFRWSKDPEIRAENVGFRLVMRPER